MTDQRAILTLAPDSLNLWLDKPQKVDSGNQFLRGDIVNQKQKMPPARKTVTRARIGALVLVAAGIAVATARRPQLPPRRSTST